MLINLYNFLMSGSNFDYFHRDRIKCWKIFITHTSTLGGEWDMRNTARVHSSIRTPGNQKPFIRFYFLSSHFITWRQASCKWSWTLGKRYHCSDHNEVYAAFLWTVRRGWGGWGVSLKASKYFSFKFFLPTYSWDCVPLCTKADPSSFLSLAGHWT